MFSVKKSHVFLTNPAPPAPKTGKKSTLLGTKVGPKKTGKRDMSKPDTKLGLVVKPSQRAQEDYL